VLNGDDSAFYSPEIINKLIEKHISSNASFTFLTIEMDNPAGLGRIVRDENGKVKKIVEDKDATGEMLKIQEINPACYVFKVKFLKKYLPKIRKSSVTGEYYIVSLVDVGIKNNERIETLRSENSLWRGVNTKEELQEAENIFLKTK
ncbi:MAG: sugar phosphate nucleotidyltransferase, partial [Patescibacteria group bacterium]